MSRRRFTFTEASGNHMDAKAKMPGATKGYPGVLSCSTGTRRTAVDLRSEPGSICTPVGMGLALGLLLLAYIAYITLAWSCYNVYC